MFTAAVYSVTVPHTPVEDLTHKQGKGGITSSPAFKLVYKETDIRLLPYRTLQFQPCNIPKFRKGRHVAGDVFGPIQKSGVVFLDMLTTLSREKNACVLEMEIESM
jgi:hypothetical protein